MNAPAAISDPLLRRGFGRLGRPSTRTYCTSTHRGLTALRADLATYRHE